MTNDEDQRDDSASWRSRSSRSSPGALAAIIGAIFRLSLEQANSADAADGQPISLIAKGQSSDAACRTDYERRRGPGTPCALHARANDFVKLKWISRQCLIRIGGVICGSVAVLEIGQTDDCVGQKGCFLLEDAGGMVACRQVLAPKRAKLGRPLT
jgi:hypothetical protein